MRNKALVLVAGGSGKRMGSKLPKQFLELKGKPILMHSMKAFYQAFSALEIVLVLPESQQEFWKELCKKHQFDIPHQVVNGGAERFHSVHNGLMALKTEGLVAIHDGVRPLLSSALVEKAFQDLRKNTGRIPVVPVIDSLRDVSDHTSQSVNRSNFKAVQTPQVFHLEEIKAAFEQGYRESFTDEASVFEKHGGEIELFEGESENIKITRKLDLKLAELILEEREN